ncbi:MAG: chromosomal replication initiator protein DnaA [Ignavibacteria bacterium]|nr:chromosomal replication initiator protein DnaA [Ignavibacteria bacterium]
MEHKQASFETESHQTIQSESTDAQVRLAKNTWGDCLVIIRARVNSQSFKTWFDPIIPLKMVGNKFFIQIPSQFFSEWLEEHYYSLLTEALTQVRGTECTIEYIITPEDKDLSLVNPVSASSSTIESSASLTAELAFGSTTVSKRDHRSFAVQPTIQPSLNPRYTFANYIKGESNQFARAAALAVSNNPGGTSFNPLVIYGGVGLGKTHLVHAIGNHLVQTGKTKRVLYVSSEKFTVDFVESIQKDSITEFSNYYRSVDLLVVDDIQFFAGKEKTQDIFFHTFNALHQLGKQIVLSSDKPPKDLRGLNERLISRFQWGLTADIQPPDLETRIAILRKKSGDDGFELPHDVVEFIAANVTSNIRELEGCLISLLARASLENREIDLDLAKDVVRSIIGEVRMHITIEEIQRVVCEHLGIPEDLIRAKTRKQEVVNARQVAMYLSKELTNSSLKTIGLHFGGRDHSTVIHAYQTVEDSTKNDPKQKSLVQQLRSKLERNMG